MGGDLTQTLAQQQTPPLALAMQNVFSAASGIVVVIALVCGFFASALAQMTD